MKYWLYKSPDVLGPYEARELHAVPGFSRISLVCPEESAGDDPRNWVRASAISRLWTAEASPPNIASRREAAQSDPRSPAAHQPGEAFIWPPPVPPAVPGGGAGPEVILYNRIAQAEYALQWLAEQTGRQDNQMGILRSEIERGEKGMAALRMRMKEMGNDLLAHAQLISRMDEYAASLRRLAESLQAEDERIEKLKPRVDSLTAGLAKLDNVEPRIESLTAGLADLEKRAQQAKLQLQQEDDRIERGEQRAQTAEQRVEAAEKAGTQAAEAAASVKREAEARRREADSVKDRLDQVEREMAALGADLQGRIKALRPKAPALAVLFAGAVGGILGAALMYVLRPSPRPKEPPQAQTALQKSAVEAPPASLPAPKQAPAPAPSEPAPVAAPRGRLPRHNRPSESPSPLAGPRRQPTAPPAVGDRRPERAAKTRRPKTEPQPQPEAKPEPQTGPQPTILPSAPNAPFTNLPGVPAASEAVLQNAVADGDVLVLSLSGPVSYQADFKADPPILVLDLIGVKSGLGDAPISTAGPHILQVAALPQSGDPPRLRLAVRLKSPAAFQINAQAPGLVVTFTFPKEEE
ncbi:MAG: AMIN domain-containing protein [Elusimicrobia bacterium]|nr:AMIN domain-containing protein [Elusimicrobiota bacterium]